MQEEGLERSGECRLTGSLFTEEVQDGEMPGSPEYDVTEQGGKEITQGDRGVFAKHPNQP